MDASTMYTVRYSDSAPTPLTPQQFTELCALMNSCWWARDRTHTQIQHLLDNSSLWIAILDQHSVVVGFARVLTDWVARAFLEDVMVSESMRGRKIGARLLDAVKAHPRLRLVEQIALDTNNTLADKFYGPAGWAKEQIDTSPSGGAHSLYYPAGHPPDWLKFHPA